ncbi:flagellar basal body-associated protein FliL [Sulfitobacter sp. M368]|uniref:flagellar basal body-associated FliL family protein n=1 Tax=Sulfitobacter sp. M368 TaxID=2867021 RepID=UPI0021A3AD39|nr:flagellar basal body-associated FliL family protein [Sulfitobacter sp. M368]UWR15257.1 flagellar basal body-associated FliL family protein [Sulfitobacter sp. M368]
MSEDADQAEDEPPKKSKLPLIIGLVLALAGGGGGFYATWSGMILGTESEHSDSADAEESKPNVDVAYVPVDPLVISLQPPAQAQYLRFRASLEVPTQNQAEVEKLMPRVVDVLNSYLRALEPADLEHPAILTRIRAQMLRRVQVIAGLQKVNDLLIMEFVLN